jgi:hypothetical protein
MGDEDGLMGTAVAHKWLKVFILSYLISDFEQSLSYKQLRIFENDLEMISRCENIFAKMSTSADSQQ